MKRATVVATVHFSLPWRNCGSEVVLHELLKAATQAGHDVTCFVTDCGTGPPEEFDGVKLIRVRNIIIAARMAARLRPHVWYSHHQHAMHSIRAAKVHGARSVYGVHNDMDLNRQPLQMRPDLVIHNSQWVKESLERFGPQSASMVFYPPLTPDRHQVEHTGDAYTLVNLNEHKGAHVFYDLARAMPDRKFVGVVGGHGPQIRRRLPNVEILEHGPDMRRVWEKTRVLLMPSIYESYGLVAQEAAVNGIPTIANPTPGLIENLGDAGLFADRDDLPAWQKQIEALDDVGAYAEMSLKATLGANRAMAATRRALDLWDDWIRRGVT